MEINILQHLINYNYDNGQEMPEREQLYIKGMIEEGYKEGELNDIIFEDNHITEIEISGWWKTTTNK